MSEPDEYVKRMVSVKKEKGEFTILELRAFLAAADKVQLPDSTPVRVRTGWRTNRYGAVLRSITSRTSSQ